MLHYSEYLYQNVNWTSVTLLLLARFSWHFHQNGDGNIIHHFGRFLLNFQLEKVKYSAPNWHRKVSAVTSQRNWKYYSSFGSFLLRFQLEKGQYLAPNWQRKVSAGTSQRMPYNIRANNTDDHAFALPPLCMPAEVLLRRRRPYCVAMTTPLRSFRKPYQHWTTAFVFSMPKVCTVGQHSMRPLGMQLRCCGDACVRTASTSAICIYLGCWGIAVRTLLCVTGV